VRVCVVVCWGGDNGCRDGGVGGTNQVKKKPREKQEDTRPLRKNDVLLSI